MAVENNVVCTQCGTPFHMKPYRRDKRNRKWGYFCCKVCLNKYKETKCCGEGNHQWGLKGHLNASHISKDIIEHNNNVDDILVYVPEHPYANNHGRVKKHRLVVEQYHDHYWSGFFDIINGCYYLKPTIEVHHIDCDHDNNEHWNLMPCTKSTHVKIHNVIKLRFGILQRDAVTGQFKTSKTDENKTVI